MRSRSPVRRPSAGLPRSRHSPLRNLARAASWHRRKLAVLAAVATVLTGLVAAAPPVPDTTPVVWTRAALAGGAVLRAEDLETVDLPRSGLPDRAVGDLADLVGKRLAAPLPRHSVLTSTALVAAEDTLAVGHVLAPVRLTDAGVVGLLAPGDRVDVVATGSDSGRTTTVARSVRVVTVPAAPSDDAGTTTGGLVLLDVPQDDAEPLAQAVATATVTVIWA